MRKIPLVTNHVYHIFNRGVNKNDIFFSEGDYKRFLLAAKYYITKNSKFSYDKPNKINNDPVSSTSKPKVEILAYCLMPNHFHFLIKQLDDNGITSYMRRLMNGYVHYVNIKYKRVGPLFQGRFKNILVDSDSQFLHLSRYIHLNPLVSDLTADLKKYAWSSYPGYISNYNDNLSNPKFILGNFKSKGDYERFVLDHADYAKSLEDMKHHVLD